MPDILEDKKIANTGSKTLSEYEASWYKKIKEYLYDETQKDKFRKGSLVSRYRDYNNKFLKKNKGQPGATLINDIWLNVPPTAINVHIAENNIDVPQIRSKHSVKLSTGYGEVSISIDLVFTEDALHGVTFEDEINYKVIPLLTQLRNIPFVHVENKYLKDKLVDAAQEISDNKEDVNISSDADVMLTYVSHNITTMSESPTAISVRINFLLFNYLPFTKQIAYVRNYYRSDGDIIDTDYDTDKILFAEGPVYEPSQSYPFYEFHATEFKRIEELLNGKYSHKIDKQDLEFTYYTYLEIEKAQISSTFKKQVDNAKRIENLGTSKINKLTTGVYLPISGRVSSVFGAKEKGLRTKPHSGTDIAVPIGTEVKSLYDGVVTIARYSKTAGNYIKIKHANNMETLYMHLSKVNIKVGTKIVKNKTVIGLTGSTGHSTGPHLHYEVRINGKPVDPQSINAKDDISSHIQATNDEIDKVLDSITQKDNQIKSDDTYRFNQNISKTTFSDKDNVKQATDMVIQKKLEEYLNKLDPDSYDFVLPTTGTSNIYIRFKNHYNADISNIQGINLVAIENLGGHDVPRIPINGYKYATHQYLGGHVEKVAMHFVILDESGDKIINDMQKIFRVVSNNSLKYREVSALDGIGIKNSFMNAITGSQWWMLDDIEISTHNQVPGGSMVKITLTDYSQVKDFVIKAHGFRMEHQKHSTNILQEMFDELMDIVKPTAEIVELKTQSIEKEQVSIITTSGIILKLHPNKSIPKSIKVSVNDIFDEIHSVNILNKQTDTFGLRKYLKYITTEPNFSDRIGTLIWGKNKDLNNYINTQLVDTGGESNLDIALRKALLENFYALRDFLPKLKKKYSSTAIDELEMISTPAYLDFDLPATINPDYYFYQPNKYTLVDYKMRQLFSAEMGREEVKIRWEKYVEQLRVNKMADTEDPEKSSNIIYQMIGKYKDKYDTMVDPDKVSGNYYATNMEVLNQDYKKAGAYDKDMETTYKLSGMTKTNNKDNGLSNRVLNKTIGYKNSSNFVETIYKMKTAENDYTQTKYDLSMCFPSYKIYLIEEDDTEVLSPFRRDLNDLYGLNAIQEIRYVGHNDQPADLLTVRFLDLSGRFSSAKFKEKPWTESKSLDKRDTELENPLKGIMIKEGTRVQFRCGYSNNINKLETLFNGQVTSIDGELNEFSMICQSFGTELVYEKKGTEKAFDPSTANAETKELLSWAISQPEVKHFGKWKLSDSGNYQFSDSSLGVVPGTYIRQRADGTRQRVWSWTKDEADLNIIAPDESAWTGMSQHHTFDDGMFSLITNLTNVVEDAFNWYSDYWVYNMTLWDVIDEMTYRYPGYISRVVPYGDRNTLFYGPPESPYFYRPLLFGEKAALAGMNNNSVVSNANRKTDVIFERVRTYYNDHFDKSGNPRSRYMRAWGRDIAEQRYQEVIDAAKEEAKEYLEIIKPYHKIRSKSIRPFRRYWLATSENNIVKNKIRADYRGVYNQVNIIYSDIDASKPVGEWDKESETIKLNAFLQDEDLRTTTIIYPNAINKNGNGTMGGAYRYGTHELQRQAQHLYKGSLVLIGNALIKPSDMMVIFDDQTKMQGQILVREHVLSIAPGEGMISTITPGMASHVSDLVGMSTLDAWSEFMSRARINDLLSASSGNLSGILPTALMTGGVASSVVGIMGGLGAGFALTPLGMITMLGIGGLMASLAIKAVNLAQYRQPVILSPLMRNGTPYIVGMNTYRTGSLIEWADNEWKLFNKGLDNYYDVISSGLTELLKNTR